MHEEEFYTHDHGDGVVHSHPLTHEHGDSQEHSHEHDHNHEHGHTHTQTKAVINRLSRAIGHLESVKRMVESGRDCTEVLMQLAAVQSALNGIAKVVLKDHIEHCIVDAVNSNDLAAVEDLNRAIERFMK